MLWLLLYVCGSGDILCNGGGGGKCVGVGILDFGTNNNGGGNDFGCDTPTAIGGGGGDGNNNDSLFNDNFCFLRIARWFK